jgi:hypothetical protein
LLGAGVPNVSKGACGAGARGDEAQAAAREAEEEGNERREHSP